MARRPQQTISLWAVIEDMQRRLEAEGLDRAVVDAAVTRGLEALLELPGPATARPRSRTSARASLRARGLAKA